MITGQYYALIFVFAHSLLSTMHKSPFVIAFYIMVFDVCIVLFKWGLHTKILANLV